MRTPQYLTRLAVSFLVAMMVTAVPLIAGADQG